MSFTLTLPDSCCCNLPACWENYVECGLCGNSSFTRETWALWKEITCPACGETIIIGATATIGTCDEINPAYRYLSKNDGKYHITHYIENSCCCASGTVIDNCGNVITCQTTECQCYE